MMIRIAVLFLALFFGIAGAHAQTGSSAASSTVIPNNTTAIVVKASAGQIFTIECFNNSTTIAYIKIYNATSATAGAGTPSRRYQCPSSASSNGAGFVISYPNGDAYTTGITYIVTTGITDADTTAPAASVYIVNIHYR